MSVSDDREQSFDRSVTLLERAIRDLQRSAEVLRGQVEAEAARELANGKRAALSAAQVRAVISARRLRCQYLALGDEDASWALLLELLAARMEGRRFAVTEVAEAAGIPLTTSLRRLQGLEDRGLVVRRPCPRNRRIVLMDLSDEADDRLRAYLAAALAVSPWIL